MTGCNAPLIYVEIRQHLITPYLRAKRVEDHIEGCIYRTESVAVKKGRRSIITEGMAISEDHIKRALRDAADIAEGKRKKSDPNATKASKRTLVDKNTEADLETRGIPSDEIIRTNDGRLGKEKEPSLFKVHANTVSDIHIGNRYIVYGDLESVSLGEDESKLYFETQDNARVYAYLGTAYKTNSQGGFELLPNILEYLVHQKDAGVKAKLCCDGFIRKVGNDFSINLLYEPSFVIDSKSIFSLTANMKK